MTDFTIVGGKSTLTFTRSSLEPANGTVDPDSTKDLMVPPLIDFKGCLRCEMKDLTIDWNWNRWRIASLARFVNASTSGRKRTWVFTITAPTVPAGGVNTDIFYEFQSIHPVDPKTLSIGVFGQPEFYLTDANGTFPAARGGRPRYRVPNSASLPPGALDNPLAVVVAVDSVEYRVRGGSSLVPNIITRSPTVSITFPINATTNNFGRNAPNANSLWMIKHITYQVHGIRLQNCVHCFFTNVTVRSAPGKAVWIDRGSRNLVFDNFKVDETQRMTNTTSRPMSGAADGIWGSMTEGNILIEDSEFGYLGDDPINIHIPTAMRGFSWVSLTDSNEPNYARFTVKVPAWRMYFSAGNVIQFANIADLSPVTENGNIVTRTVFNASYNATIDGGTWTVQLTEAVPATSVPVFATPSTLGIVNRAFFTKNVIIRNVKTKFHRARGILIQAENVLIEKSELRSIAVSGILARSSAFTQEGVGAANVLIANNYFYNVDITGRESAIIVDAVDANQTQLQTPNLNRNVTLLNNHFERVTK
jgi:hypothetical protein